MKTYILIILAVLLNSIIIAQQIDYGGMLENNEEESLIKSKISAMVNSLNKGYFSYPDRILTVRAIDSTNMKFLPYEGEFAALSIKEINISINDNYSNVYIKAEIISSDNETTILEDTLRLIKLANDWQIDDLGKFNSLSIKFVNDDRSQGIEGFGTFYSVTPYISDRTCILKPQMTSPTTFDINANFTVNQINRKLYKLGAEVDAATYTNSVNPDLTGNTCVFTLDSKWNRIIYSKRGSNDIKSYGDNTSDIKFIQPTAIEVNEYGEVYVVDNYTKKIHKLTYNYGSNSLIYNYVLDISNNFLQSPYDIDYASNGTAFNTSDDFILVTDLKRKSILKLSHSGTLLAEYTSYFVGMTNYDIQCPLRVATIWSDIFFIESSNNSIVTASMSENGLNSATVAKLPTNFRPTDIGVDQSYTVLVSDGIGLIHKFSTYGEYLCSYRNSSYSLQDSRRVSNSTFSL